MRPNKTKNPDESERMARESARMDEDGADGAMDAWEMREMMRMEEDGRWERLMDGRRTARGWISIFGADDSARVVWRKELVDADGRSR
jgi:hypothetical protein